MKRTQRYEDGERSQYFADDHDTDLQVGRLVLHCFAVLTFVARVSCCFANDHDTDLLVGVAGVAGTLAVMAGHNAYIPMMPGCCHHYSI